MSAVADEVAAVCCGIFRAELNSLDPGLWAGARPLYFDSMMHMRPAQLDAKLDKLLAGQNGGTGRKTLIVYGDCCPHMAELSQLPGVARVEGVNCCEIILGPEQYRRLRREGAFFLLPEWTARWREVFQGQLGFSDPALARQFMHELHTRLIYVDTGVEPVPRQTLEEIAAYFAMPVEVLPVGLEHLSAAIAAGLERVRHGQ
jgi:hypothetical protein